MFSAWMSLVAGLALVMFSFIVNAKRNIESKVLFKVVPFLLGAGLLLSAAQLFGYIVKG